MFKDTSHLKEDSEADLRWFGSKPPLEVPGDNQKSASFYIFEPQVNQCISNNSHSIFKNKEHNMSLMTYR